MTLENVVRDRIVYVPVPERDLPAVWRVLADAHAADAESAPNAPAEAESTPKTPADVPPAETPSSTSGNPAYWNEERIATLKRENQNVNSAALLDLVADRAGEWVTFTDFTQATGRRHGEVNGDLGSLSRLARRLFGMKTWPMVVKWSAEKSAAIYRMPPEIAAKWKEA